MSMTRLFPRLLLASILVLALGLAMFARPPSYFLLMDWRVPEADRAVNLEFVFYQRPTLNDCDALAGRLSQITLARCPQCTLTRLECTTKIQPGASHLLGTAPFELPTGRMASGVVVYRADRPADGTAMCQAAHDATVQTANPAVCQPANQPRPLLAPALVADLPAFVIVGLALLGALLAGWLILRYEHLHAHLSHDHSDAGPQKVHGQPTPRIGGIALAAGLLLAGGALLIRPLGSMQHEYALLLLSAAPAFVGGLIEDLTKRVGVIERLLLTMIAGAAAAWLLGGVLNRLDVPVFDQLLVYLPFAVIFTAFAVGGISNAINIIDGVNGLAGGFAILALACLAFIANQVGDALVFYGAAILAGSLIGFLFWNWPSGRLFLGDGGAYLVGFMLSELAVLLVVRNPAVSPWFPMVLLVYPVFETFFSIYRRKVMRGRSPGHPDGLHLHQLIFRRLVRASTPLRRNSRVAPYLWIANVFPMLMAVVFWNRTGVLLLCALAFCLFYVINYWAIVHFRVPDILKTRLS